MNYDWILRTKGIIYILELKKKRRRQNARLLKWGILRGTDSQRAIDAYCVNLTVCITPLTIIDYGLLHHERDIGAMYHITTD
jgi:hypothetical protein